MMKGLNLEKSRADDCLYILKEDGVIVLLALVYVDDMAIAGHTPQDISKFKENIKRNFDITEIGELSHILGIQVICNKQSHTISINQSAYISRILTKFGMQDCSPVSTPLAVKHNLSISQSPQTNEEHTAYLKYASGTSYLEIIGSLLYATQT